MRRKCKFLSIILTIRTLCILLNSSEIGFGEVNKLFTSSTSKLIVEVAVEASVESRMGAGAEIGAGMEAEMEAEMEVGLWEGLGPMSRQFNAAKTAFFRGRPRDALGLGFMRGASLSDSLDSYLKTALPVGGSSVYMKYVTASSVNKLLENKLKKAFLLIKGIYLNLINLLKMI